MCWVLSFNMSLGLCFFCLTSRYTMQLFLHTTPLVLCCMYCTMHLSRAQTPECPESQCFRLTDHIGILHNDFVFSARVVSEGKKKKKTVPLLTLQGSRENGECDTNISNTHDTPSLNAEFHLTSYNSFIHIIYTSLVPVGKKSLSTAHFLRTSKQPNSNNQAPTTF